MKQLPSDYYRIKDLVKEWSWDESKILHYGETGQLQICVVWDSKWRGRTDSNPKIEEEKIFRHPDTPVRPKPGGLHPLYKEDILRIRHGKGITCIRDINNATVAYYFTDAGKPPKDIERKFKITDLAVTHEEKIRFEAVCDLASSNDIGEKERITWLKVIYLLMHELADHKPNLVKTDGLNISQLETILKRTAKKHDLSDKGLSNSTLSKIYNEAMTELMPDTE